MTDDDGLCAYAECDSLGVFLIQTESGKTLYFCPKHNASIQRSKKALLKLDPA